MGKARQQIPLPTERASCRVRNCGLHDQWVNVANPGAGEKRFAELPKNLISRSVRSPASPASWSRYDTPAPRSNFPLIELIFPRLIPTKFQTHLSHSASCLCGGGGDSFARAGKNRFFRILPPPESARV